MSDWQVGDLALCIESGDFTVEGRIYTVTEITPPGDFDRFGYLNAERELMFDLAEAPKTPGQAAEESRFRKILPDQHEPCEAEFVTLLKRTKKTVRA